MSFDGQFQTPTFLEINLHLKAFYHIYHQLMQDLMTQGQTFHSSPLNQVNHQIKLTLDQISKATSFLRKKLRFYDVETDAQQIGVKSLQAIMKLPQSIISEFCERSPRRQPRILRERHRGPYRSYSIEQKNHVVYLGNQGIKYAAISKRLGIPQKNIVRWCKEGFIVREVRRKSDAEMEEALIDWIRQRRKYTEVRQHEIQSKAREMASNRHFKASRGWLKNFLARLDKSEVKIESNQ